MNPKTDDIYGLITKSLTGELDSDEKNILEQWKFSDKDNLKEYNEIVRLWIESGSLKMPLPVDLNNVRRIICRKTGIYKKRWISLVTQIAAVLILSFIFSGIYAYWGFNKFQLASGPENLIYQEIKAAYGTQSKVLLSDGTVVYLNSGSKLIFPQTFTNQKQRNVTLEGEAYFEVTKNREQPFVVKTNKIDVKVLGTKFNVDAYHDNTLLSIALVEGSVELQGNAKNHRIKTVKLTPHQVATFDSSNQTLSKTDVADLNKYTAWINGRIVFFDDPIRTVVQKLSKWYNVDIVIADKKLENYRFTGTFINDPVERVLTVFGMSSHMTFSTEPLVRQSDNTILKRKIILKSKI